MMTPLADLASLIRSKNAGPFALTFDILFQDEASYRRVKNSGVLTRELFAEMYQTPLAKVKFFVCDNARAFKFSIPRVRNSGDLGDGDLHGGQQFAPLLEIQIPDPVSTPVNTGDRMDRRFFLISAGATAFTAGSAVFAQATYPARPVKFIVPFAPGGGSDTYSRLIAQKLNEKYGYTIIIYNKPGAGGNLGAEAALREPADGYTFLVISGSYAVNALLNKPAFDPINAIQPVVQFTREANALAVSATAPYRTLQDLVADGKKNPGKIAFGSPGVGSQGHVAAEYFASVAGIKMTHVPYKGTAATLVDLVSGQIQVSVGGSSTFAALAKAGKIRILGVVSPTRLPSLPNVPTFEEQGFGEYKVYVWHGLVAAKATPPTVIGKMNADINAVLRLPEVRARLAQDEVSTAGGTPAQFEELLRSDMERWRKTIKQANITLN